MTGAKPRNGPRRMTGRPREVEAQITPAAVCRPIASALEARPAQADPVPIWYAALVASRCHATGNDEHRSV